MTDRLGYRLKLGVVIPSTNSIVQPETDAMRPPGVTNHIGRIHIPDLPLTNDTEFEQIMVAIEPDPVWRGRQSDVVQAGSPDHGDVDPDVLGRDGGRRAAQSAPGETLRRHRVARLAGVRRSACASFRVCERWGS